MRKGFDGLSALAPVGFEVSEDGGATWSKTGFTAAIGGAGVTLTRGVVAWAAGSKVRFGYGGSIEEFTVAQTCVQRTTGYAAENTALDSFPYESRTDAAPRNGGGSSEARRWRRWPAW